MSVEDFAENREFLNDIQNASVEEIIGKLVEQHGAEVAKGFLIAMVYMQPKVRDIYCDEYIEHKQRGQDTFTTNSYNVMMDRANNLTLHIGDLLQTGSALTGYPEQSYLDGVKVPRRRLDR